MCIFVGPDECMIMGIQEYLIYITLHYYLDHTRHHVKYTPSGCSIIAARGHFSSIVDAFGIGLSTASTGDIFFISPSYICPVVVRAANCLPDWVKEPFAGRSQPSRPQEQT
jgi:hypothetical protein